MSRLISKWLFTFKDDILELSHILMLASLTGQADDTDRAMVEKWVGMVVDKLREKDLEIPEDLTYHFSHIVRGDK